MLKKCAMALIRAYQFFISPMLGKSCRFHPTCSEYAMEALSVFGFWKGMYFSTKRILRCNPFANGGYDPVHKQEIDKRR